MISIREYLWTLFVKFSEILINFLFIEYSEYNILRYYKEVLEMIYKESIFLNIYFKIFTI